MIASTHSNEEIEIIKSIKKTILEFNLKIYLAPRHPERINTIKQELNKEGFSISLESKKDVEENNIVIIDSFGKLDQYFKISDLVILGGSFLKNIGGHNPIEPACYGCVVISGKYVDNWTNIYEDMVKANSCIIINTFKEIDLKMRELLNNNFEILSSSLDSLHDELETADIVVASSITEIPLIGKGAIENALKKRKYRPILLIDLGVPRNIEDEIKNIEQAYLFSIDDIEKITQDNYGKRSIEAEKAMNIIALEAKLALNSLSLKTSKDRMNLQLEEFLRSLSDKEIEQFRLLKNYSSLVQSIKTMDLRDDKFNNFADIKNLDDHIIESMIKRFFDA